MDLCRSCINAHWIWPAQFPRARHWAWRRCRRAASEQRGIHPDLSAAPATPARFCKHCMCRIAARRSIPASKHGGAKAVVCMGQGKDFPTRRSDHCDAAACRRSSSMSSPSAVSVPAAITSLRRRASHAATFADERPDSADDFVLLYTSGTVSAPKGVPTPYRKFLANARLSAHELRDRSHRRSCSQLRRSRISMACSRPILRIGRRRDDRAASGVRRRSVPSRSIRSVRRNSLPRPRT